MLYLYSHTPHKVMEGNLRLKCAKRQACSNPTLRLKSVLAGLQGVLHKLVELKT